MQTRIKKKNTPGNPSPYPLYTIFHEKGTCTPFIYIYLQEHTLFRTLYPFSLL